jgi:hypothetical protein
MMELICKNCGARGTGEVFQSMHSCKPGPHPDTALDFSTCVGTSLSVALRIARKRGVARIVFNDQVVLVDG